jgi:hypothetical protein
MGVMVNPPKPGDISYLKFAAERLNMLPLRSFSLPPVSTEKMDLCEILFLSLSLSLLYILKFDVAPNDVAASPSMNL